MFSQLTPSDLNAWTVYFYTRRLETELRPEARKYLEDQIKRLTCKGK